MMRNHTEWQTPTCIRDLAVDQVHLWRIPLVEGDQVASDLFPYLSMDERHRAQQFRHQLDRNRYVVSRGALRQILAQYLQRSPEGLQFTYGPHGKPELAGVDQTRVRFNVSHAADWAICAISCDRTVGVDLECLRPLRRLDSLVNRCLSPQEQQAFRHAAHPPAEFLRYWTGKEAYLKAVGKGLTQSMQSVEIVFSPQPRILCADAFCWSLHLFSPEPNYTGALVVAGHPPRLQFWHYAVV